MTPDNSRGKGTGGLWFAIGLAGAFFALEMVNVLHHAPWRDEMQVWAMARRAHSIAELIWIKRYEGHPDTWHLIVYLITRITTNPIWMQIAHAGVASVTAFLVARYSPFSRTGKVLIVFGYFFFFEYAAIAREYAFGVLGVVAFCTVFRAGPRKRYALLALFLGLMCQGSVYGMILALALVLAMAVEAIRTPSWWQSIAPCRRQLAMAGAIAALAIAGTVVHMRPPPDSASIVGLNRSLIGLSDSLSMFWLGFVPIPQVTRAFWNSNIILSIIPDPVTAYRVTALLGVMILCVTCLFFVRRPVVLLAYVCGEGALLVFKHVVFRGFLRHDGFAFVLFLACVWLASGIPEERLPLDGLERLATWFAPLRAQVLFAFLIVGAIGGIAASAAALTIPFSQAQATAEFIRSNRMDGWPIIGDKDYRVSAIAGYLNRDFYYVAGDRPGSYMIWDRRRRTVYAKPAMPLAAEMAARLHHDVLVVLSYPCDTAAPCPPEIASFTGAAEATEDFHLYIVRPPQGM